MTPTEFYGKLAAYHVRAAKNDGEYVLDRSRRGRIMVVSDAGSYHVIEDIDGPTLASGTAASIKSFLTGVYDLPFGTEEKSQPRPVWIIRQKYDGGSLFTVVDEERSRFPDGCSYPSAVEGGGVPGDYYISNLGSRKMAIDFIDTFGFTLAGEITIQGS